MSRDFLKLFLLFVFLFSIHGCDFRVVRDYKQLVYHMPAEPNTLNPITRTDAYSATVDSFIFDYLLDADPETGEWKPNLVKKWEISRDHLVYTFYLRDDIYWHDGVKMTVDDIIFSLERIKDPKVDAAVQRVYYKDVTKVERLDDYTVRFTYSHPYFLGLAVLGTIPVVPKHLFENNVDDFNKHPYGRHPVGNGPYKFKEWKTGQSITVVKNDNYWKKSPEIAGIVFRIVTDMNVALQVLKKGEIDLMELSVIQWKRQTESKNFENRFNKYRYFLPNFCYIGWNRDRPYFVDSRVRRAMTMLLDREKIREKMHYNLTEIVTGPFYKFGSDYDRKIEAFEFNPEESKRLLYDAGWIDRDNDGIRDKDGVPFRFTFMTTGTRGAEHVSNMLREEAGKVGIGMEVSQFEWAVFGKNLNDRAFDATILCWSFGYETDPYQVWHSTQADKGSNYIGFANSEADQIIIDARKEFDVERRNGMYKRFHAILHEDQPYTFLYMTPTLLAVQKRFTNVKVYKLGIDIREWGVTKPQMVLYQ